MSRHQLQLTVQAKVMILVVVPLIVSVVLLLTLYWLYFQQKEVAERVEEVKNTISKMEIAIHDLYEIGYSFIAYGQATNKFFERKYLNDVSKAQREISELKLVQHNQNDLATLETVNKQFEQALSILAKDKSEVESGHNFNFGDAMNLRQALNAIVDELTAIYRREDDSLKPIQKRLNQLNQLIPFLILLFASINVVIALLLVIYFQQDLINRIQMVMVNIANLAKHETLKPVLSGDDEIARIDLVFHQMADELHRAERQKQEFVDMISHDLRTPLSAVQTSLALLSRGTWGELNEKGRHKVIAAENNVRRSITLINNLLDLERMESGKLEIKLKKQELMPILEICLESVSQLAEQRNTRINLPETEAVVNVDDARISQVVLNLLGNAIKFSPENSEITIRAIDKSPWTEVRVSDTGPGIPATQQKLIFERFHQAPGDEMAKAKGTGLGLAICRLIVESHGGSIGVDSEEGKGSTFWFSVPSA